MKDERVEGEREGGREGEKEGGENGRKEGKGRGREREGGRRGKEGVLNTHSWPATKTGRT